MLCVTCLSAFGSARASEKRVDVASEVVVDRAADTVDSSINNTEKTLSYGETQWAMGIGLGVFNYNYYPGAEERNQFILPAPYFTYRSPKFEVDRGIKSFLYNGEVIVIDLSADFGLPVNSDDTIARKGMPDLDFVLQFGPSIEFLLNGRNKNYFDVRFEIPVRVAFTAEIGDVKNIGYLLETRFTLNHQRSSRSGLSHKATLGFKFATQDFNAYYYDVAAQYATPDRPEYESDAGFGGSFVNYRLSYHTGDFVYWTFVRYQSLRGAEFQNSPLVLQNDYYFLGIGFAWVFASSL